MQDGSCAAAAPATPGGPNLTQRTHPSQHEAASVQAKQTRVGARPTCLGELNKSPARASLGTFRRPLQPQHPGTRTSPPHGDGPKKIPRPPATHSLRIKLAVWQVLALTGLVVDLLRAPIGGPPHLHALAGALHPHLRLEAFSPNQRVVVPVAVDPASRTQAHLVRHGLGELAGHAVELPPPVPRELGPSGGHRPGAPALEAVLSAVAEPANDPVPGREAEPWPGRACHERGGRLHHVQLRLRVEADLLHADLVLVARHADHPAGQPGDEVGLHDVREHAILVSDGGTDDVPGEPTVPDIAEHAVVQVEAQILPDRVQLRI
mmetsp:Transcript_57231/g.177617  ORF Transcript_57231/g.177617 Transcript_57231/m.177617 type:complete len:321 (-) Transcript_57231:423-1385(-)